MSIADYIKDPAILWRRKCAMVIDQVSYINGGTSTGSANAYTLDLESVNGVKEPIRLLDGIRLHFIPNFTNTSTAPTVTVSSYISALTIKASDGTSAIAIGDLVSGIPTELEYDESNSCLRLIKSNTASTSNKESILQFNDVSNLLSTTSGTAVTIDAAGDDEATQSITLLEGDKLEIEFSFVFSNSTAGQTVAIEFYNATNTTILETFRVKNIQADSSGYESHASFKKRLNVATTGGDITPGTKTIDIRWFRGAGTAYMSNYYYKLRTYRVN